MIRKDVKTQQSLRQRNRCGSADRLWNELSDSVMAAGWNFDETPAEFDSDDSSDDKEFELLPK
jgi:hypothetical protein